MPIDPITGIDSSAIQLPPFYVGGGGAPAALGVLGTLGDIASAYSAIGTFFDVGNLIGDLFMGNPWADISALSSNSVDQAIVNGAHTLTNFTPQLTSQQILNNTYLTALNGGATPEQALSYATQAAGTADISAITAAATPEADAVASAAATTAASAAPYSMLASSPGAAGTLGQVAASQGAEAVAASTSGGLGTLFGTGSGFLGSSIPTNTVIQGIGALGSALISSSANSKNASLINNAQYQPIDLAALQTQAQQDAAQNYANSIALQKQFQPNVSAARDTLAAQVESNLKNSGNLPADVRNAATQAAITGANSSGFEGAGGPLTAAQLGTTATNLQQLYQANATSELAANPLPTAGLDPGALASAAIGNNNAQNNFNLSKIGAQTNLNQSTANTAGSFLGALSGIANNYYNGQNIQALTAALNNKSAGVANTNFNVPASSLNFNNSFISPNTGQASSGTSVFN